jgi:hypothetical protein
MKLVCRGIDWGVYDRKDVGRMVLRKRIAHWSYSVNVLWCGLYHKSIPFLQFLFFLNLESCFQLLFWWGFLFIHHMTL